MKISQFLSQSGLKSSGIYNQIWRRNVTRVQIRRNLKAKSAPSVWLRETANPTCKNTTGVSISGCLEIMLMRILLFPYTTKKCISKKEASNQFGPTVSSGNLAFKHLKQSQNFHTLRAVINYNSSRFTTKYLMLTHFLLLISKDGVLPS